MLEKSSLNREKTLNYIQALLLGGISKKDAYKKYINPEAKDIKGAIRRMEKHPEFKALAETLVADDTIKLKKSVADVRQKYVDLVSKNIDAASQVLDKAAEEGSLKNRGAAVRLVNETITALSIVNGPQDERAANNQQAIDRTGVIIS